MSTYALLTIDLHSDANDDQRESFYCYLEEKEWIKIENLTTAWKREFSRHYDDKLVSEIIERNMRDAKEKFKIKEVVYAYNFGSRMVKSGKA